nr:RNA-directed DNA polymerase, eukaryota, reverse transcriptase zinc-binding domain protein [Tanacetum cinerariifolium]
MVDGVWKEQSIDVKKEFLNHFQERFDKPVERRVTIDMSYPRSISGEQRDKLEREVTIEEIKTTVWNYGTDKSPGPDGFTFDFYRQLWSTIDKDVYAAFIHFFINGDIPAGCNSSFIALILKVPDANLDKDFRPISLIGSIYKIIAKILTNRLINILGDIVSEVKSAFVAGRQILDGPFILNEVLHWCSKKKQKSLIFKVDFEKAYDSVRWDFLDDVLKKFGFSLKINLCKSNIMGVSVEGSYVNQAAVKLGCQVLTSPFVYLDSIWTKVITVIHGVNGNVNSSGGKAGRSCWLAIVDEVRALYKKGVYVFDFMNLKLGNGEMVKFLLDRWFEGSATLGGIEQTQFSKLVELVQSISLMPINDRWVWNLESLGEFSVACIRRIIDEMRFLNIGDTTRWVKYVPIKVNILAWKIRCDVLLTIMNLSRRGIDIQAISCPICDYGVESSDHLFFRCNMIRNIGKQIVRWWNINYEERKVTLSPSSAEAEYRGVANVVAEIAW